ncbi:MAG: RagB/SusD family nutrient uptake outer membrane protein, partial [Bacteroidota bacterium]
AWPGEEAAMQITAGDVDIDFLLDERARELDGEMHRWFDLARVRISDDPNTEQVISALVERTREHNPNATVSIQNWHIVRPIPQDQIDRTVGGYPQNPGYPQ